MAPAAKVKILTPCFQLTNVIFLLRINEASDFEAIRIRGTRGFQFNQWHSNATVTAATALT